MLNNARAVKAENRDMRKSAVMLPEFAVRCSRDLRAAPAPLFAQGLAGRPCSCEIASQRPQGRLGANTIELASLPIVERVIAGV